MISSISELMMKLVGCILKDAEKPIDYLWLLLFLPILIGTATRTLVYVNYGIKYYEQLEVMPIYQNCLLMHNIIVGMICLNELKFYTAYMLLGITVSAMCCVIGILFLLEKNREKMAAVPLQACAVESDTEEMDDID